MKEIPLTQGMVALVDDEDYEGLAQFKWYCMVSGRTYYAVKHRNIRMHRIILNTPHGYETDHINGNGLDNRKENLRVATKSQNQCNTGKPPSNTSGFKGVGWRKDRGKWQARIKINHKKIYLGHFQDKLEAVKAYNEAAIKYHGEFASLNSVSGQ